MSRGASRGPTELAGKAAYRPHAGAAARRVGPHLAPPDSVLFGITKYGLVPGKYAPPKYESDMPAFGAALSDEEIWAVLTYIKSSWPSDIRKAQHEMTRDRDRR
jgi:mono/diheme cytochrome c family protein